MFKNLLPDVSWKPFFRKRPLFRRAKVLFLYNGGREFLSASFYTKLMKVYNPLQKYLKNKKYRYFCQRSLTFHESLPFDHHYKPNIAFQDKNWVILNRLIRQKLFHHIYLLYYPAPLSKKWILYVFPFV